MRKRTRSTGRTSPGGRRRRRADVVQYTVRDVPAEVDRALRRKAGAGGRSLNAVLREALIREAQGGEGSGRLYTDLDTVAGSWIEVPGFDEVVQAHDQVDDALWR
jgi:plasmid stability protein